MVWPDRIKFRNKIPGGVEALRRLEKEKFDSLVFDRGLPKLDGLSLTAKVLVAF